MCDRRFDERRGSSLGTAFTPFNSRIFTVECPVINSLWPVLPEASTISPVCFPTATRNCLPMHDVAFGQRNIGYVDFALRLGARCLIARLGFALRWWRRIQAPRERTQGLETTTLLSAPDYYGMRTASQSSRIRARKRNRAFVLETPEPSIENAFIVGRMRFRARSLDSRRFCAHARQFGRVNSRKLSAIVRLAISRGAHGMRLRSACAANSPSILRTVC